VDDPSLRQNRCFLWHVIGGPWRVPVGGMGAVAAALADAAARAGAELRTGAEALRVDGGEVTWREDGREHSCDARFVLAGVAPEVVAELRGLPRPEPAAEGCQMKVNMLLDRLPRLRSGVAPEDAFTGTFRLYEHEDDLAAAYASAAAGKLPERPPAELYCHSLTDRSILGASAPAQQQTLTLFGLHTPARLFRDDNDGARTIMVERYLDALDRHLAEPIRDCLATDADGNPCIEAKTPVDLERELGMPEGNIFHGELDFPWTEEGGGWGVETDDPRVLLCGAGALRGGGVSGIGGHNAAMAVLERVAGRR
jgi:phytoene dehydrogenase-like protein